METSLLELASIVVPAVLTLFVFSYLLGDNVLYRLAEHLFVGVALGYALVVAFHSILAPKLLLPLAEALSNGSTQQLLSLLVALVLGLLLLLRPARRFSWLGSISVAILLGVGAALAIAGALLGTFLPQVSAAADIRLHVPTYGPTLGLASGIAALLGTIAVLAYFHRTSGAEGGLPRLGGRVVQVFGRAGRWLILIAFSAILASTFLSRLSLLSGRLEFLIDAVRRLLGGMG
jgi:hypothetical protein